MISEKLMMALLALDAYSRSTEEFVNDVRIFGLGGELSNLGGATVVNTWNVPASSFAATEYSWNGKTIISFRGTDNPLADLWSGWTLGAGWAGASQAKLALDVYAEVTGKANFEYAGDDVILTGHSLGGGLAGYLSVLTGTKAYGFDHMTFGPAAMATLGSHLFSLLLPDPTAEQLASLGLRVPSADNFIGSHVEGEILVGVRDGSIAMAGAAAMYAASLTGILAEAGIGLGFLLQAISHEQSTYEANVQNGELSTHGWSETWLPDLVSEASSGFDRHSQGLLVLLSYADENVTGTEWASSGFAVPLISALYDDNIALSAGINSGQNPGYGITGRSNPADLMLTEIAYSVLEEGNRPFGDSAIRSLFNDAESVGDFVNGGSNALLDLEQIADKIALFAAWQARHAVIGQHDGFISHSDDMLLLDFTGNTWTFNGIQYQPARFYRDLSNVLLDGQLSSTERAELDLGPNRFDAEYYSNAVGGWHGQVNFQSDIYTVKAVGTDTHDTIIGTDGDEQILLGAGNDTVKANGGVNWIDGGDGDDTLIDDHAWSEFEITYDAQDERYYFALRDTGADPRIHVLDNMEVFKLDGEVFTEANVHNVGPDGSRFSAGGLFYEGFLAAGQEVARLEGIDGNAHDAFTWALYGDSIGHFYLDGNVVRALHDITFDYEEYMGILGAPILDLSQGETQQNWWQFIPSFMQSAYVVQVIVRDSYKVAALSSLVIGVGNVNEAPVDVRIVNPLGELVIGTATLPENLAVGTLIGRAVAADPDGDGIVWSLEEDGGGRFRIDEATGEIFVHGNLDHETVQTLEIVARATDQHSAFTEVQLVVTLVDVEESIDGTAGDDTIHGTPGMDVINGLGGIDTIYGYEANDRLYGGTGNDTFYGGTGSDAMFGDADNDTFHLGEAVEGDVDYINGGTNTTAGDNVHMSVGATYRLDASGAAAIRSQIVANGFTAPTGHGVGIEMAVGDAFVQGVETIKASAGENDIRIGKASELLGSGAKVLDFTAGSADTATFMGAEHITVSLTADAGRSKATFNNASGVSVLGIEEWNLGDAGSTVSIDKSYLALLGVVLTPGAGIDILNLQSLTTDIVYGAGPMIGGTNITASGFDRVYGGSGSDTFYGTDADENFLGFGGTNTFHGSLGADSLNSGENLIADYSLSAAPVLLDLISYNSTSVRGRDSSSLLSMGRGDTLSASGWSEIRGSMGIVGNDALTVVGAYGTLVSNGGNDTMNGSKGNDTFHGADGYAEIILPGDGSDSIHFGTGGGTLDFSTSTRPGVIDWAAGTFVFGNQTDTVTGQFAKLVGTQYGDTIHGTENADIINGGTGSGYDVIYGRGGNDNITVSVGVVHGGDGNDTITGGTIIFGEDGEDILEGSTGSLIYGGDNKDTITAYSNSTVHGDDGDDTITTVANSTGVVVHGGAGADTITMAGYYGYPRSKLSYSQSDAGVSLVQVGQSIVATGGHAEGDKLFGMFNLDGSAFGDIFDFQVISGIALNAGAGDDTIAIRNNRYGSVSGGDGIDTITLFGGDTGYGDAGNDVFHGHGGMYGGADDDEFFLGYGEYYAGAGSYVTTKIGGTVYGGTGQNTIHGGLGNDTVHMNEGADTFIYSLNGGHDQIYGAGADDTFVLNGIAGFDSFDDVQANLVNAGGRPELHFAGNMQKIGFMGMTMEQVLALDWAFT